MKEIHVKLEDADYERLKEDAEKQGTTMSEYLRDILGKQAGIAININFIDIDNYANEIQKLINITNGLASVIWKSNAATPSDVQVIKENLVSINDLCNKTWRYVVGTRTKMYDEVRKSLYSQVRHNNYKRRRKYEGEEETTDEFYTE